MILNYSLSPFKKFLITLHGLQNIKATWNVFTHEARIMNKHMYNNKTFSQLS